MCPIVAMLLTCFINMAVDHTWVWLGNLAERDQACDEDQGIDGRLGLRDKTNRKAKRSQTHPSVEKTQLCISESKEQRQF